MIPEVNSNRFEISNRFEMSFRLHGNLEHVYIRHEVNSNRFEISDRFEMSFRLNGNLHGDFTAAIFQTIASSTAHVQMISFN